MDRSTRSTPPSPAASPSTKPCASASARSARRSSAHSSLFAARHAVTCAGIVTFNKGERTNAAAPAAHKEGDFMSKKLPRLALLLTCCTLWLLACTWLVLPQFSLHASARSLVPEASPSDRISCRKSCRAWHCY